ncbi:unnamed protein product [Pleuronectes platessa]|uniref:Uncharacterized protein n=1 Tax=Pleuronectes platessa TaxID=8262 RepID=A0A9N7TWE0_PLEPL|nr:unnamed protein product [Pleuronectes platessa]
MDKLSVLLTLLCLPCLSGQALESIPSTALLKTPREALSLSCKGTGNDFMNFLKVCYKDLMSCRQLQQKKRGPNRISVNTDHVLSRCAAAAGCWTLCEV